MNDKVQKIVIAGASGFVGRKLINYLLDNTQLDIVGLSRKEKVSDNPRVSWRKVDLFSMLEIENAVEGCDYAIYLVHSMLPSANLDQGTFEDYDLLLADNFASAIKKNNIKQVVYLGGIIPSDEKLSPHLRSRLEVEHVFEDKGFAYTHLRAGLIIGTGGSSFNIMFNLVKRLPILVCPAWTQSKTTPIHIDDVIHSIGEVVAKESHYNKLYEIGGASTHTYMELLKILANKLNLFRFFFIFPLSIIYVSRLWVKLFSGASKELVYPLLESLKHSMAVTESRLLPTDHQYKTYPQALDQVLSDKKESVGYSPATFKRKYVRSVQRLTLPEGKDAVWVAQEYMRWLPDFLSPFIKVTVNGDVVRFNLFSNKINLLELTLSDDRSFPGRTLFYITSGLLAIAHPKGRLEFRETLDKKYIITAIHDFIPALPWFVYKFTQAIIHLWVMVSFGSHLSRINKESK